MAIFAYLSLCNESYLPYNTLNVTQYTEMLQTDSFVSWASSAPT